MAVDIEIPITDIAEENEKPSKTYALDLESGRISGMIDGLESVNQAIKKAVLTRRFNNLIYDDDYGCEAESALYDKDVTREYLETAIPEMIEDALSPDTRILKIYDFEMEFKDDSAYISFKADTIFGDTQIDAVI
ncbi:MAG: DUF2634 domain-containing protein [Clostridium sp.]|nr:DUF2634 domain-containing protein [Clostridium sp.]